MSLQNTAGQQQLGLVSGLVYPHNRQGCMTQHRYMARMY